MAMSDEVAPQREVEHHEREYNGYTFTITVQQWYDKSGLKLRAVNCEVQNPNGEIVGHEQRGHAVNKRPGPLRKIAQSLGALSEQEDTPSKSDHVIEVVERARRMADRDRFGDPDEAPTEAAIDIALDDVENYE